MATKSRSLNELIKAIKEKRWHGVSEMCKAQPDLINEFTENEKNPLEEAVRRGAPEEILLQIMEQANKKTLNTRVVGLTILHRLVIYGYTSALARALEISNDNINALDLWSGSTPLHWLLMNSELTYEKHKETTKILLNSGGITTIKNKRGKTPIDFYKDNHCWNYDENKRKANKAELLLLLEGLIPEEILARGTKAIQSYMDELNNGETTMVNSRIMVLGKEGTGKTSTINAILGKELNENEPSTDGIVTTTVVQNVGKDCTVWEAHDVDVCELTKEMHDNAIAENVAKKLNTNEIQQISEESTSVEVAAKQPSSTAQHMQISATASALTQMDERKKAKKFKKRGFFTRLKLKLFKKSYERVEQKLVNLLVSEPTEDTESVDVRIPDNVEQRLVNLLVSGVTEDFLRDITSIWDYAGQPIYYISHRLYITNRCVYYVVFSLVDKLNDIAKTRHGLPAKLEVTNLEMVVFFVRSIYEHAVLGNDREKRRLRDGKIAFPPIVLVGTHKDKLKGSESEKLKEIEEIFFIVIDEIKKMPCKIHEHVDREIYAVDNNNPLDEGIQKLMKNSGDFMNGMVQTIPISWVNFQGKLQEAAKTRLYMSLLEITEIAVGCGISRENLTTALNYLNDVGVILYSKKNQKLKNTVIINLHEMIKMMKTIITVVKTLDLGPALEVLWERLDNKGILEEELLHHLWEDKIKEDASNLDVFLEVMKKFGLLFEKEREQGKRIFLVPSRMTVTKTDNLEVKKDDKQTASIYVTPTDFLPDAVYSVLVVGLLNFMEKKGRSTESEHVKLFQNCSDFDLYADHCVRLGAVKIQSRHALKLEISCMPQIDEHGNLKNFEPNPKICIEVLNYLKEQLETVYGTMEGVGYELNVCCNACKPMKKPLHKLDECLKDTNIRCGNIAVTTARVKRLFGKEGTEEQSQTPIKTLSWKQRKRSKVQEQRFMKLLTEFSKHYRGSDYRCLKFLLYDKLPIKLLSQEAENGMTLLNKLASQSDISPTNVVILTEIATLTNIKSAKSCITAYKGSVQCKKGRVLTTFRRTLFRALTEIGEDELPGLVANYQLDHYQGEFRDVWDLTYYLEREGLLDSAPDKFGKICWTSQWKSTANIARS